MADTSVGVFLRADGEVKVTFDKVHGPWIDIRRSVPSMKDGIETEEEVTELTFYIPKEAEDCALICDMFIASFKQIKDSLPESVR